MHGLCYDLVISVAEKKLLEPLRKELLSPLTGFIIELGAGTGRNFPYYRNDTHVLALEPDRSMARSASRRVIAARAKIDLVLAGDSYLDSLAPRSADAVVLSLVLCTINDPALALRRVRRILKNSGKLVVLEHVRSPIAQIARFQDIIAPLWSRIGSGCRLNRDTSVTIAQAGFDVSGLQHHRFSRVLPIQDLLFGTAPQDK